LKRGDDVINKNEYHVREREKKERGKTIFFENIYQ